MTDRTWGQNGSLFTAGAAKYQSRLKKPKKNYAVERSHYESGSQQRSSKT